MVTAALSLLLAGCAVGERETTLLRSRRAREVGELRAEREQQERDLAVWQATRDELLAKIAAANAESVERASELRVLRAQLLFELDDLHRAEGELEAARRRAEQIEQELAPLRALERTLAESDRRIAEAKQRVKAAGEQLAAVLAECEQQSAALAPKLAAAQQKLAALKAAGVQIAEAEARVAAAAKVLAPPPAPEAAKKQD